MPKNGFGGGRVLLLLIVRPGFFPSSAPPGSGKKKGGGPPVVHIHHKFIVIDAETDDPIFYTGSNSLSENSTHHNDGNLEIKGRPELARTCFAEFMRLYQRTDRPSVIYSS
jgi:phosphatidylserine/phosphatidylglycerophosphate/cardiolipin synthase-like enzyme